MEVSKEKQAQNAINWILALLSGKYKQGKGVLGNEKEGFCCWGLGCFIIGKEYNQVDPWDVKLFKYIGFTRNNGRINPVLYGKSSLDVVNDYTTAGFKRIGKYLIKHSATNFNEYVSDQIQKYFNSGITVIRSFDHAFELSEHQVTGQSLLNKRMFLKEKGFSKIDLTDFFYNQLIDCITESLGVQQKTKDKIRYVLKYRAPQHWGLDRILLQDYGNGAYISYVAGQDHSYELRQIRKDLLKLY